MHIKTLLQGAGLGAALMYLYDPERGRRRRALLVDQYDHAIHRLQGFLAKARRDIRNRARGLTHETKAMLRPGEADDQVIAARVRSKLGRYTSHPRAIEVEAHDGRVVLAGAVLADEVKDVLNAVRWVRGVKDVEDRLDVYWETGDVPRLQGGRAAPGEALGVMQSTWSPTTRALAQLGGLALMGDCLVRRNFTSTVLGTAGFVLFVRAATNRSLGQLVGVKAWPRAAGFHHTVIIRAPIERVWGFMTDFEQMGRFLPGVKSVQDLGDGRYRWTLSLPAGQDLELEERVTEIVPHERLAWESVSDSPVSYGGTVRLQPDGDNATRVNVHFEYTPPGGVLADQLASLFRLDPESKFQEAVVRIKTFLETGHPPHDVREVATPTEQAT